MLSTECNIVQHLIDRSLHGFSFPSGCSPFAPPHRLAYEKHLLDFRNTIFTDYQFIDQTSVGVNTSNQPMYCCSFGKDSNTGHLLAYGGEDGNIFIVDSTRLSESTTMRTAHSDDVHDDAVIDVSWVPNHDELVSCSGDKSVVLWKLGQERLLPVLKLVGHKRTVKTVQVNPYDPMVIVSGSRDCNIVVWDRRCGPQYRADHIAPAHPSSSAADGKVSGHLGRCARSARSQRTPSTATPSNAVASLVFYEQHTLVSAGSTDGLIKLWDLRKTHSTVRGAPVPVHTLSQPQSSYLRGFGWACAPERSHYLYALGMDCKIYGYHLALPTTEPVSCYTGCRNMSHYVRMSASKCGRYLVCGGADGRALVWLTSRPGPPVAQLTGHAGEVSAVDWGQFEGDKIATCGDDCRQKIFYVAKSCDKLPDHAFLGKAEPVDDVVLSRCPTTTRTSSKRRLHRFSSSNTLTTWSDTQHVLPVPKTPSSRREAQIAMSTPLRESHSGFIAQLGTPGEHAIDTSEMNVYSPAPLTPSHSINDYAGRRAILSTPRQRERIPDSSLPAISDTATESVNLQTPQTPSSLDKSMTLLQWLSTVKKTPQPSLANATPKQSNENHPSCSSASKKAGIKRKLTDVLELDRGDEENLLEDGSNVRKKKPTSPTQQVLSDLNNHNPSSNVAKMLVYCKSNDGQTEVIKSKLETISEIGESVQPFDSSMMDTLRNNSLRNSFNEKNVTSEKPNVINAKLSHGRENSVTSNITARAYTPVKAIARHSPSKSRFESPTANLPNFVEDGASPRPVPVFREKRTPTNWLSAIASQRKLKFGTTPDAKTKGTRLRQTNSATKRGAKQNVSRNGKKYLRIVPLSNTPSDDLNSAKKTTQTKLVFN
ncbi:WD40 repeat [Trinorchestia longiramus]|nr:WD40 repeat [Trinorchestia longiramus]